MASKHFSDSSNSGQHDKSLESKTTNGEANGNQGFNVANNTGISEGPSAQQSFKNPNQDFETEYLSSANIATFHESLIEELNIRLIMLKKSLDKVLEMRVTMAQLKLSLKEISSPDLMCKAEDLNAQLASLEESNKTFNEMILSLTHEIQPFDNHK